MVENVYYVALAGAIVYVVWKMVEVKYVRKASLNVRTAVVDACSVFVSVVVGSAAVGALQDRTKSVVGVFPSEPGF